MHQYHAELKSLVQGLAIESKRYRKFIKRAQSPVQLYRVQGIRRTLSQRSRYANIAYGLMRNIPYLSIERKCREDNRPNPKLVQKCIFSFISTWEEKNWSIEKITELLKRP